MNNEKISFGESKLNLTFCAEVPNIQGSLVLHLCTSRGISHFRAATSGHVTSIYFPAWRSVI
jgi:hypothetical protein